MQDMNSVNLVARLASDPELRSLPSGTSVCSLRVAFNTRRKNGATGEWEDVGNFVNVTVWGKQGESVARNLRKGSRIGISGYLEHRTWEAQDGSRREAHQIVAHRVQYLTPKQDGANNGGGGFESRPATPPATASSAPLPADDDIPF